METTFDRVFRFFRPVVFITAGLSFPVFIMSYLYTLKMMFTELPWWAFLGVCFCHAMVWIAASTLHDLRQERQK